MGTATNRKFAVVTGASSGIGFELAKQCIEHNFDLLICSEDDGIHAAARHLGATGAAVEAVHCDLATYEGCEKLVDAVNLRARALDALILNAGVGVSGAFVQTELDDELRMIGVNVMAVVHLAKRLVPRMINRGEGRVLITASVASTSPAPFLAVYGATKAFDLSFAEALRFELKGTGVTVTALQPGATETEFFERADMLDTKVGAGRKDDPEPVARQAFEGLMNGDERVEAGGLMSKLQGRASRFVPDAVKSKMHEQMARPGSAK
jgi:uncharacterized protein